MSRVEKKKQTKSDIDVLVSLCHLNSEVGSTLAHFYEIHNKIMKINACYFYNLLTLIWLTVVCMTWLSQIIFISLNDS